jgi:hypothetical protein
MQVFEKIKLKKLHILLGTVYITYFILKMEYTLNAACKSTNRTIAESNMYECM